MKRLLIAGNWKMNLDREKAIALAKGVAAGAAALGDVDWLVCPPSVYLDAVGRELKGTSVSLGGQNAYHEVSGAYTGETSVAMLKDVGCRYVILGHSERRHVLGETNEAIQKKVLASLAGGLTPIVCVGELLEDRDAGRTTDVVSAQLDGSLKDLSAEQVHACVLAYEPVWAIGTGRTASPEQAQEVHSDLRKQVADRYNSGVAAAVRILYGGSVKPGNAGELLGQADIDGALVGGASLEVDKFLGIGQAVASPSSA